MGTSASSSGPGNKTPLVPTWCDQAVPEDEQGDDKEDQTKEGAEQPKIITPVVPVPIPAPPEANRFAGPRGSFSSFAKTGNRDTLYRALRGYVGGSSGGARSASHRMAGPQRTAGRILSFSQAAASGGTADALKRFGLADHVGRTIAEVLPLLIDALCPDDGGSIDEGIARDALTEAVAELSEQGLEQSTEFTADQLRELFICFVSHSIKDRVLNDVGINGVKLPNDVAAVQAIERTTLDVIRGCVRDAVGGPLANFNSMTNQQLQTSTQAIYEAAYSLVAQLGEE